MNFSKTLIAWYLQNKRSLPWRETTNPYFIWLSEIILQQTRVAQGKPYYDAFLQHFPTVQDLAFATEQDVLKLWQGLGYYSRARNLHATAKYIVQELEGQFPNNYNNLLSLKGVGEYTAAAIASFAYNEPVAVVDGNVFRVLSRIYGLELDISEVKTKKEFQKLAQELLPIDNAALFNQAIMEFGALQCVPKSPNCSICVFQNNCYAFQKKKVDVLPVKSKKIKIAHRYFYYLVLRDAANHFVVSKREEKGIWHNLYEFTLLEYDQKPFLKEVVAHIQEQYPAKEIILKNEKELLHKLSHQHLHIHFIEVSLNTKIENAISMEKMLQLPMPIVIHNFIAANYL
ncbi:A/G-specific adenine glycosylase [Flavobacterium sp. TP390]|uniref:Adenine DNA glycosylase n=1 Tax=Flavobacterium profundi TaxID=1774945 RepID=A0A6I4ISG5_9FLAO|nr:A/G-specific adenine glycosylase [Flavobacterium profundi]MVO08967.1 A/G-specific adenine glycosylase [Flavobacterium profundi]